MKLVYTQQALTSLEEIVEFISQKESPKKLDEIREQIPDKADTLMKQPFAAK